MVFIVGEKFKCDVKMRFFGLGIKNLSFQSVLSWKRFGESLVHPERQFAAIEADSPWHAG
ncbi:MAG TPA: hypothetical protein DEP53_08545 [Bacteroidetes bacterium]|nr:hypothetical protein [Bacteroidota bacterium]